jgi:hypothetical protein
MNLYIQAMAIPAGSDTWEKDGDGRPAIDVNMTSDVLQVVNRASE